MQIETIKPTEFGLQPKEAENVLTAFAPKAIEFKALISDYLPLLTMELSEAVEPAKELKKKLIEFEKEVNKLHKTHKEFSLNYGRFVDSNKNIYSVTEHKKKLDEIIKHEELKRKAELKVLSDSRKELLSQYMESTDHLDMNMSEEVFTAFLNSKKADFELAQEKKKSDEIIAKIYQSNDLSGFNVELFGSHIEERKKQLLNEKLLKIERYTEGDLGFELDSPELQEAYNARLLVLDGLRVERIKSEMQRLYNNAINVINTNISNFKEPIFDAQEFSSEWISLLNELQTKYSLRREYLSNVLIKMPDTIIKDDNVYLGDTLICNINKLSDESIVLYNSLLGGQQSFENWVNSFTSPALINDKRCEEINKKFEAFKKWALTVK